MRFFHHGHYLRATTADRSFLALKPAWAAPLSQPGKYLAFLESSGEEAAMIEDPAALDAASRAAVDEELRRRYLTATVTRITRIDPQHGPVYITAETDRGPTTFCVQHLQDNAIWFSETHVLLIDTESNRFDIDLKKVDLRSISLLKSIL